MRKEFTLLIPRTKDPNNIIDIFLAPLINKLKELCDEGMWSFNTHKAK